MAHGATAKALDLRLGNEVMISHIPFGLEPIGSLPAAKRVDADADREGCLSERKVPGHRQHGP